MKNYGELVEGTILGVRLAPVQADHERAWSVPEESGYCMLAKSHRPRCRSRREVVGVENGAMPEATRH